MIVRWSSDKKRSNANLKYAIRHAMQILITTLPPCNHFCVLELLIGFPGTTTLLCPECLLNYSFTFTRPASNVRIHSKVRLPRYPPSAEYCTPTHSVLARALPCSAGTGSTILSGSAVMMWLKTSCN